MEQITIEFDENGDMKIEASGFKGDGCLKTAAKLLGKLGGKKKNLRRKTAYYKPKQKQPAFLKKCEQ